MNVRDMKGGVGCGLTVAVDARSRKVFCRCRRCGREWAPDIARDGTLPAGWQYCRARCNANTGSPESCLAFRKPGSVTTAPCLQCPDGAKAPSVRRGLCLRCYGRSRQLIIRGYTSWSELERNGRAVPVAKQERPPKPRPASTRREENKPRHYGVALAYACSKCGETIVSRVGGRGTTGLLCGGCVGNAEGVPVAQLLLSLRVLAGLTQQEVADRVGVRLQAVSLWEAGRMRPRPASLAKVLKILGFPTAAG